MTAPAANAFDDEQQRRGDGAREIEASRGDDRGNGGEEHQVKRDFEVARNNRCGECGGIAIARGGGGRLWKGQLQRQEVIVAGDGVRHAYHGGRWVRRTK